MEDHFTGNWGAPIIGADKKFPRELKDGEDKLLFSSLRSERYIFNAEILTHDNILSVNLNGREYQLTGTE